MGIRKRVVAEKRRESRKMMYFAKLNNVPISARKIRLVIDLIRGMEVFNALGVLKFSNKGASTKIEKLLKSAISNWEQKTKCQVENGKLFITKVIVDSASMLKRMRPAPQGRGYYVRKRSSHVILFVDTKEKYKN